MTPEERAASVTRRIIEHLDNADHTTGDLARFRAAFLPLIADAIREAEDAMRERCAQVAEGRAEFHRDNCHKSCVCADGWHIAIAIRKSGTDAALDSAAAHFGGRVPKGEPTIADALTCGSKALREMAIGTDADHELGGEQ